MVENVKFTLKIVPYDFYTNEMDGVVGCAFYVCLLRFCTTN